MTRPWLSVSRAADVTAEKAIGEATAIGTFSAKNLPAHRCKGTLLDDAAPNRDAAFPGAE
jgi:hypothetical protein